MNCLPNSSATRRPTLPVLAGACDAHIHIYDPRFAHQGALPDNATAAEYQQVQSWLGTERTVIVQPRVYGTDNAALLAAIQALGADRTRGIAVIDLSITEQELVALHAGGVRGIRFSFYAPNKDAGSFEVVEPLARRIHELGWHVQLHWTAEQIAAHHDLLERLPTPLVFDHLGRLPVERSTEHPAFSHIERWLRDGRAWVKLSGAYLNTALGVSGGYPEARLMARAWVERAPERLVWGSDWPHVTETVSKPDDTELFELLADCCGSESIREQVLVSNPAHLYGFV